MDEKNEDRPVAAVIKILDLISYQSGSVVSRIIAKTAAGTVTLFAFDAGQGLSEHTAPFDALVQMIEGSAEITIAGEPFQVQSGEMIIMPANRPHALHAVTRFKMILTMLKSQ